MTVTLLIAAAVILFCVFLNRISYKFGVPMLLAFIVLGMIFGTDGIFKISFENYGIAEKTCTAALIFIMFYGGFGTNWKEARFVAVKSILLSTLGVVFTAGLTGLFCYYVLKFALLESLLVGAVVSSTDAASVFSILRSKKMGLKDRTDSMLEVESGSNDPCSYMLTAVVLSMMKGSAGTGSAAYMVVAQLAFGILIGVGVAFGAVFVLRRFQFATAGFDMAFVIGTALLSYALASAIGGNGYLSVYLCGIILGNMKIQNKKALVHFFDGVTGLMQMLIFFLLGLLATPSRILHIFLPALGIMLFLTFIARPLSVFAVLSPLRSSLRQRLLVSFAGLRGAASIVFAIMAVVSQPDLERDLFHIVFCIVLLSIAFQGTLLPLCAKILKMRDESIDVMRTFSDYSEAVDLQFIEIKICEGHPWLEKTIQDSMLPPETLVVMILRDGNNLVPDGQTIFEQGDVAVLSAYKYHDSSGISLKEQKIREDSQWVGKTVNDFSPESGELVIMIIRGDRTIVPKGDTRILGNDILVINEMERCEQGNKE